MVETVLQNKKKHKIAVAWAQDPNTLGAVRKAVDMGIADAVLIGNPHEVIKTCSVLGIDHSSFTIIKAEDDIHAAAEAVSLVTRGDADIVMKGLVGTDIFLKAVMDKEKGLMTPGDVLTFTGVIEIPEYHKLLFVTDPAVIPFPDYKQKMSMAGYAVEMAHRFGISQPKVALIGASEKTSHHFPNSLEYAQMVMDTKGGASLNCIMDGPLDLFLACDKSSVEIKGVKTPVDGDADILLFPSLEASNPFYKSLMLFAKGELAGLIRGTRKPVIVMSRSESEKSKFYCIALACLMAVE